MKLSQKSIQNLKTYAISNCVIYQAYGDLIEVADDEHTDERTSLMEYKEDLENIVSTECTFSLADEYANTGFSVLSDYMKNKSEETLMWELLRETDEMFEEYEKDFEL